MRGDFRDYNKASRKLGIVLMAFSAVMALGSFFAWVWIPEVQGRETIDNEVVFISKSLESLAKGKTEAEASGSKIGLRKKTGLSSVFEWFYSRFTKFRSTQQG